MDHGFKYLRILTLELEIILTLNVKTKSVPHDAEEAEEVDGTHGKYDRRDRGIEHADENYHDHI